MEDLLDGLMLLMDSETADGVPVNLGNPSEMTVSELVALVLSMTRSRSRIVRRPLPQDDPKRRRPDISRARSLLGWEPKVELREGLSKTIDWFAQEHRSHGLSDSLLVEAAE